MLGGGVFVTQNKILPGSYINFVNASQAPANLGERGIVAIPLKLNHKAGEVIEVNRAEFVGNSVELIGVEYSDPKAAPLREIFKNATKVYVYDRGDTGTASEAVAALEPYEFNILCAYTGEAADISAYTAAVQSWRDDIGKKCQVVVYNATKPDYEGVINLKSTVSDNDITNGAPAYALTAWLAGAEAGCNINESCTNKLYNGEYTVVTNKTQSQLEQHIKDGEIVFHLVYGEVRLLEDVNSLTTTTLDKGEDFKSNQTMRVVDQIANDIAKLFNTKYLGKIPNDASGRVSLWGDIVKHHKELEQLRAIENFDPTALTVLQGDTKKSVVVNDVVIVTNAMAQLYMTVVVQ